MDLVKLKKDWEKYETAFGEEEYMDIDSHTDMSFKVPQLIREVERVQEQLNSVVSFSQSEIVRYRDALEKIEIMPYGHIEEFVSEVLKDGMEED